VQLTGTLAPGTRKIEVALISVLSPSETRSVADTYADNIELNCDWIIAGYQMNGFFFASCPPRVAVFPGTATCQGAHRADHIQATKQRFHAHRIAGGDLNHRVADHFVAHALSAARSLTRVVQCGNNLRQVAIATNDYGAMPRTFHSSGELGYVNTAPF